MGILSVCLSVCLSQPGAIPSSGEIETPGLHHMVAWSARAPEAVWQVWRPPYQSKIWYGDAIPIKSKAANLFIICKSRIKTSAFYMFLSDEF